MTDVKQKLELQITEGFKKAISLTLRRPNLYQLFVPYYYPDGDMIEIFLTPQDGKTLIIQDMGLTLMRLSYEFSMESKNKQKIFNEILSQFSAEEKEGNIQIQAPINQIFPYLMQFIQLVTRISDISYLKREIVKSLFYEYFDSFIHEAFDSVRTVVKDYYPEFDQEKQYPSPYALVNGQPKSPICFFPVASDSKCNDATIIIQQYELKKFQPESIAVYENMEVLGRRPVARLSNVVGKQFSTLQGNQDRITDFTNRLIS
ncbi:MAG: DUF1828 domain-containing protein [Candidatus Beckwithbacteria bacterium]|nr:DUF1828 domain-containing protein [Patescibacteria group bacterium]